MNRNAVWVLGTISGVILALTILGPFTLGAGYSMEGSCSSPDASPCAPQLQEVNFSFGPLLLIGLGFLLLAVLIGLPAWIASPVLAARRGASSKPVIIPLAVLSLALLLVSIYFSIVNDVISSPRTCFSDRDPVCVIGANAGLLALVGALLTPSLICVAIDSPAWVMALVRTARIHAWGWFVAILLLSPVATLLYGFFGPELQRPVSRGVPPPPMLPAAS